MSENPECRLCGVTAFDLPDGFGLEDTFEDGLCPGCQMLEDRSGEMEVENW